jgi:predicted aspartyl protease
MRTVTPFDTSQHHIHTEFSVADRSGWRLRFDGVIDTGAPWTEFSDEFLARAGLVELVDDEIRIKPGLETQKYAKILLPSLTICGHTLDDFKVMVSRFDAAWGVAALIGLDFFRRFKVTIDYGKGVLVCEQL